MASYYLEIIVLSIIQGITEFIPVSSSAHLVILSKISNFSSQSLEIDISLHLGSLLAIITYFFKDLTQVFKNKNLLNLIILGSLPLISAGSILYFFEIIYILRDLKLIAWSTLIFGILLYFADKKNETRNFKNELSIKRIFVI